MGQLDHQHWQLSNFLMSNTASSQDSQQLIADAQNRVRQNFRDLRDELDQREEVLLARVEQLCRTKIQQQVDDTRGGEEHLEKVDRCRELGNRMCQIMKPMMLPFCNKLLFSKAQRLLQ